MGDIVFLDGTYLPEGEAKISISDRGLLMGDGVFVTICVREGVPLFLKKHLHKLTEQAHKLSLAPIMLDEKVIEELIEKNAAFEGVWRLKIYYTAGDDVAMRLPFGRRGRVIMILKPYAALDFRPLNLGFFPQPIMAPQSSLKSLSHIGRYMVMEDALQRGFDDNITTTTKGEVLETAFGNIFWIKGKEFYTPNPTLPLHFGVTISVVVAMMRELGFASHFVNVPFLQIPEEAFLFRCNTMGGIRPIVQVEGQSFPRDLALEERVLCAYEKEAAVFAVL